MADPILEIGAAGLETTDEKVKSLVNRMVNAETPGFKSSDVSVRSFPLELESAQQRIGSQKPAVDGTYYDHSQGTLIRTGKPTDLALESSGFFVVSCPWGEGYTRDGRFTVDKDGRMVSTVGNYPLLSNSGPVVVDPNIPISISEIGELKQDTTSLGKIRVVDFSDKQALESVNGVIFRDPSKTAAANEISNPQIIQGFIEGSNAKAVDQMVDLIQLSRIYNMDAKIVSVRDGIMTKANEIGKMQ